MATRTEEISAGVRTTGVGDLIAVAESLLERAREKYEDAAAHGWGGVVSNLEQVVECLEGVVEHLESAEQSGRTATETLDEIGEKTSSQDVVEHLVTAIDGLDEAVTSASAAVGRTARPTPHRPQRRARRRGELWRVVRAFRGRNLAG